MRPTLRTFSPHLAIVALAMGAVAMFAPAASAMTLYDGSYSTDLSTSTPGSLSPDSGVVLPYPASNLRLSWSQVPGAKQYQLQVARQNSDGASCNVPVAFQLDNIVLTTTTTQSEWAPTLQTSAEGSEIWTGTYCWRVRTTGAGPGEWSTANRFTRTWASTPSGLKFYNDHDGAVPRDPSSSDYATGSSLTRNAGYVTWNPVAGASKYEVQVSPSRTFSENSIIASRDGVSDNRVVLLHLPDDTYYWRVRGVSPNGTEGAWSTSPNTFTVKWYDPNWSNQDRLYPPDSSTQSDVRIGWTSMPGASHYEYQVSSNGGCFWDPTYPQGAPDLYGAWTTKPAVYSTVTGAFLYTQDPLPSQCRLSKLDATTINNWVTLQDAIDPSVFTFMSNPCVDSQGRVTCERAHLPDSVVGPDDDMPTSPWRGSMMSAGQEDGLAYTLSWRVRPVYVLGQDSESGWKVAGDKEIKVYGSWTKYRTGGANREERFNLDPATAPFASIATRCDNPIVNPLTNECLVNIGATMAADQVAGAGHSNSMQVPVITWRPFQGAGGYIVQIARDPLFNNMERSVTVPALRTDGYGFQQSWVPTDGLVDNEEDTGYWWRVIPCDSAIDDITVPSLTICSAFYSDDAGGLPPSADPVNGYSDMAVAQTFKKQTRIQTSIVERFEGATPLIRWSLDGTSPTDYPGWSQGVPGAHHYEVQLARDPFMSKDLIDLNTTIPRIAPFRPTETKGEGTELDDGIWYYRVRPIDRNGILGTWSTTSHFNKRIEAPGSAASGGGGAQGPGVVVAWDAVQGADTYDVQWSTDSGFETGIATGSTRQTVYRIPDTTMGRFYWRVRAVRNGVQGQWSLESRYIDIVPATTLRYALNRPITFANEKVTVTGELKVAGTARNGKSVRLQRKGAGCDAPAGQYVDVAKGITGRNADDGLVSFPTKVAQNTCYRLAWDNGASVSYSAPIPVLVAPRVVAKLDRKKVVRGKSFCVTITGSARMYGTLRVQYRKGTKGPWTTSRSALLRNAKAKKQCATIPKAGRYSVRVTITGLYHPTQKWKQFEDVTVPVGTVKVNDVFRIVRG